MFKKISSFVLVIFAILLPTVNISSADYLTQNYTESISVNVKKDGDKLHLEYEIVQGLFDPENRHGIFFTLPKNQDGIWTKYEVISAKRAMYVGGFDYYGGATPFEDEKYQFIKEWNQMRVRFGDKNTNLPQGIYIYKIEVLADYNSQYNYDFTLIKDWVDVPQHIFVNYNGKLVCQDSKECTSDLTKITLNPGSEKVAWWHGVVNTLWVYFIWFPVFYLVIYFLYKNFAKDKADDYSKDTPEFEPPKGLTPWQAQYLIKEGNVDLKNTLLSYLLWLNNKKYIKISPTGAVKKRDDKVKIEILKDVPEEGLPAIFKTTIEKMAQDGVNKGLRNSKINPGQHQYEMNKVVGESLANYYDKKPINGAIAWAFGIIGGLLAVGVGMILFLQNIFLLGYSLIPVLVVNTVLMLPGIIFLFNEWGRVKDEYYKVRISCLGYKYYLKKVEKYKLDFSNNPKDGVQYYLKSVPFAAAFGVLDKFQKYMAQIMPQTQKDIDNMNSFLIAYNSAHFYHPPARSSSGGSFSSGGFSGGGGSW